MINNNKIKLSPNTSESEKRYFAWLAEFRSNGFSDEQAKYLLQMLNDFLPLY